MDIQFILLIFHKYLQYIDKMIYKNLVAYNTKLIEDRSVKCIVAF